MISVALNRPPAIRLIAGAMMLLSHYPILEA